MILLTIFLIIFDFFRSLGLSLIYISRKKIIKLSFISILILLYSFIFIFFS